MKYMSGFRKIDEWVWVDLDFEFICICIIRVIISVIEFIFLLYYILINVGCLYLMFCI